MLDSTKTETMQPAGELRRTPDQLGEDQQQESRPGPTIQDQDSSPEENTRPGFNTVKTENQPGPIKPPAPKKEHPITAKERRFLKELKKDPWNISAAAKRAKFKERTDIHKRIKAKPALKKEVETIKEQAFEEIDVETAEIIREVRDIAFYKPEQEQQEQENTTENHRKRRVTVQESLKALEMLGRYKVIWTDKVITDDINRERRQSEREHRENRELAAIRLHTVQERKTG
ncbi:MAG: terminase small subunit [Planctomycetota bacterium]|jgi:hypothetical protein